MGFAKRDEREETKRRAIFQSLCAKRLISCLRLSIVLAESFGNLINLAPLISELYLCGRASLSRDSTNHLDHQILANLNKSLRSLVQRPTLTAFLSTVSPV